MATLVDEHVRRLDVAVHEAALVCRIEGGGDLRRVAQRATRLERALLSSRAADRASTRRIAI